MNTNGIQDQQLREHPEETMRRLRDLGEWPAADRVLRAVKQAHHRRYKKAGGELTLERRVELAKAAWDAVHDRWPPAPDAQPLESLIAYVQDTKAPAKAVRNNMPALSAAAIRRFDEVGETDDLAGDTVWVYHNVHNPSVNPFECPSRGAWSLLEHAREDLDRFYRQYLKPAMAEATKRKNASEGDYTPSKAEKMACEEIRKMIEEAVAESQGALH